MRPVARRSGDRSLPRAVPAGLAVMACIVCLAAAAPARAQTGTAEQERPEAGVGVGEPLATAAPSPEDAQRPTSPPAAATREPGAQPPDSTAAGPPTEPDPGAGETVTTLPVPSPDLESLEPAVAEQLASLQKNLLAVLERPGVPTSEVAQAFGDLGQVYLAYGLTAAAEASLANAAALAPRDFRWVYLLAYVYQQGGKLEQAAGAYDGALGLRPDYPAARVRAADVALALDDLRLAEALLNEALNVTPESPAVFAGLGQVALARREYAAAVERFEQALARAPGADRLHYLLGQAYRGLGDLDRAREHLEQSGPVGVRPEDQLVDGLEGLTRGEAAHTLRGRMAFRAGHFEAAVAEFRRAVDEAPDSARARVNLGGALAEAGQPEAAIEELRAALALEPGNATASFNLGILLERAGKLDEAREHYAAAAAATPGDAAIRYQLAQVLRRTGRPAEALPHYRAAADLDPARELAWLGEAELLVAAARYGEAVERLEAAHRTLPASGLVAHALARLLAASPQLELRDGARGLALAQRVFAARPTAWHAETVALALGESGDCAGAAEWQRRAIDLAGEAGATGAAARLRGELQRYEAQQEACRPSGR